MTVAGKRHIAGFDLIGLRVQEFIADRVRIFREHEDALPGSIQRVQTLC